MLNKIKLLVIMLCCTHSALYANEYIYKDEIRGGIKQIILDDSAAQNGRIVFFIKEKVIEFQFRSIVRISGIHIEDPRALQWPTVKSNFYSIRFDPNLKKIISNKKLLNEGILYWPPCNNDNCLVNGGVPKIIENEQGIILQGRKPDGRPYNVLQLNKNIEEFDKFYLLYQGSRKIILEIDSQQYIFDVKL